jgi:CBS-domain-containing membrane protein
MTAEVRTVGEDASLEKVVELMERHRIKRVPVVRGREVVGIISRANIMHGMVSLARVEPPAGLDDATIRDRLVAEMKREEWAPSGTANVVVRNGVVDLWGVIVDERQREALKVAAENTPGVKAVKDHLVWVEPMSGTTLGPTDTALAS